jgi:hypothetical protein
MRKQNPTLVTHPLGAQTDDIYESSVAQLAFDTQSRYASLLQELGFIDDAGTFLPGTLETDAARQRADLERQRGLALDEVVNNAIRGGTVFSGRRAQRTAETQQPFDAAVTELTTRLSRELANRFQGISGLTQQFELGRNMLLSEAAERIKQSLMTGPVGGEEGGGGAGGLPVLPDGSILFAPTSGQGGSFFPPGMLSGAGAPATQGATPGAAPPARPKGMPSNWSWNAQRGYWQSPDGRFFLLPGKPWSPGVLQELLQAIRVIRMSVGVTDVSCTSGQSTTARIRYSGTSSASNGREHWRRDRG